MAFLRPGVGEVDVEDGDGGGGNELGEEEVGLRADHARVEAVVSPKAVGGVSPIPACPLDAEEVCIGASDRLVEQEGSFAAADLEFDGVVVAEDFDPIEGLRELVHIEADGFEDEFAVRLHRVGILGDGTTDAHSTRRR